MFGRKTIIWREKERTRIRAVQMNNFIGLLGIRRKDRVPNALIREICGLMKVFSIGLAILNEYRMIELLKGCSGRVWVVV